MKNQKSHKSLIVGIQEGRFVFLRIQMGENICLGNHHPESLGFTFCTSFLFMHSKWAALTSKTNWFKSREEM